ncbi:unnamed protein product [Colias eurytheme]|nr:unnamed protein product [Colias eurytheme]
MSNKPSPKSLSASDPNINVSKRANTKRLRLEDHAESDKFEQLKCEIIEKITVMIKPISTRLQSVENSLQEIKKQTTEIKTTNNDIEKSLSFLSSQMSDFETKINNLEKERKATNLLIAQLEDQHENLERNLRKTNIEIRNVPKIKRENKPAILNSVTTLLKKINLETAIPDVRDVYRLPSKENSTTSTIIVEFINAFTKDKFLKSTKLYNKENKSSRLNSTHLNFERTATPIYFSEHLTKKTKRLYFLARDFALAEKYNYCWINDGRIFLRKEEGSRYTIVKNEDTFSQLRASSKNESKNQLGSSSS